MGRKGSVISKFLQVVGGVTVIIFILYLVGVAIGLLFPMDVIQESGRRQSPDGKVDAVILNRNGGATTSLTEHIYVVPKGYVITAMDRVLDRYVPVFVGDHITGKNVHWLSDKTLEIQYRSARIYNFTNYTYPLSQDLKHVVDVRLTKME